MHYTVVGIDPFDNHVPDLNSEASFSDEMCALKQASEWVPDEWDFKEKCWVETVNVKDTVPDTDVSPSGVQAAIDYSLKHHGTDAYIIAVFPGSWANLKELL